MKKKFFLGKVVNLTPLIFSPHWYGKFGLNFDNSSSRPPEPNPYCHKNCHK